MCHVSRAQGLDPTWQTIAQAEEPKTSLFTDLLPATCALQPFASCTLQCAAPVRLALYPAVCIGLAYVITEQLHSAARGPAADLPGLLGAYIQRTFVKLLLSLRVLHCTWPPPTTGSSAAEPSVSVGG